MADHLQAGVHFQQEMSQAFGRGSAAGIDDVFGAGDGLLNGHPAQHQPELWALVAEANIVTDRTDLQLQIGQGKHGITGLFEKTAREADDVARKDQVYDLPLTIAQQLIARGKAALDQAQLAKLIAVNNQISTFINNELGLEQAPQARQIIVAQSEIAIEPDNKGMSAHLAQNYARTMHRRNLRRLA